MKIEHALRLLRSDPDEFDPTDFDYDPDWNDSDDDPEGDDPVSAEDRGYCPLCGDEHEHPDDDRFCAPADEYTLAGCDGAEFEYRPFDQPGFEFR